MAIALAGAALGRGKRTTSMLQFTDVEGVNAVEFEKLVFKGFAAIYRCGGGECCRI